ncbi:hypothetical protein Mlute_00938 [Meiothermus luteus]|jgi:hypothetical protein|uniref:Uncharacterized protein n=1 Tax=Meiothermus luteus TaxID=2026184 RepID=A0A399EVP9_9DEIN|nr:hypothetical protein [Meiothermus luteus]RIH87506.1 hypothetical protein Mlute_00938 [Meiothermus luteus]RMH58725.1 MAG: hypothetical protein D6684_00470 [Deinococcota bacterium]
MPIKYNPFTQRYEYAEEDQEPVYNEYEGNYELGEPNEISHSPYTGRYSKKGSRLVDKWNPYTSRYEQVPEDWEIQFNPFTGKYEFGPKE